VNIQAREWVDRFQRYLVTERRVSPHTVSAYGLDLEALVRFCEKYGIEDWQHLKMADVRLFAGRQHARGLVASSVRRRISAVRSFLRFLVRESALAANPADLIQGPRLPRRLPGTLTVEQMAQLLDIPGRDPGAVRDRAIMELLYSSALRLIELIRLDVEDLDTSGGTVRVLGKGNVTRIVPVGSYALKALAAWLKERRGIVKPGEPALFVGRYGRRLTGRAVQKRIEEWARLRKIPIRVTPHMFRHSCATHVLESSGSIRHVQELLGHVSISTTAIYTHLDFAHLAKVYGAAHPRAQRQEATDGPPLREEHNRDRASLRRDREDSAALEVRRHDPAPDLADDSHL
jgi:integrase/recombinase XerC